jgi:hypothetical protein
MQFDPLSSSTIYVGSWIATSLFFWSRFTIVDLEAECFDESSRLVLTLFDPSILLFEDPLDFIRLECFRVFRILVLMQAEQS